MSEIVLTPRQVRAAAQALTGKNGAIEIVIDDGPPWRLEGMPVGSVAVEVAATGQTWRIAVDGTTEEVVPL